MITVIPSGWMSESDLLRAATAVACGAGHPLAVELLCAADVRLVRVLDASNCELLASGAAGVVGGSRIVLGTAEQLRALDVEVEVGANVGVRGHAGVGEPSALCVASDGRFAGVILIQGGAEPSPIQSVAPETPPSSA